MAVQDQRKVQELVQKGLKELQVLKVRMRHSVVSAVLEYKTDWVV